MSTTRSFVVLPLIATALLAPAAFGASHTQTPTVAPKPPAAEAPPLAPKVPKAYGYPHEQKRAKGHAGKHHRHPHHHGHHHAGQQHHHPGYQPQGPQYVQMQRGYRVMPAPSRHCCPYAQALDPVVLLPRINPLAPPLCPDFADRWFNTARLAWGGGTRYFPFQPNGFYPSPEFSNIRRLPVLPYDSDVEVVGAGNRDYDGGYGK